jgi:hypothetical protein
MQVRWPLPASPVGRPALQLLLVLGTYGHQHWGSLRAGLGLGCEHLKSSSEQVNSVVVLRVRTWDGDGLSFISQGGGGTKNVKFDGHAYANTGAVVDGMTASAQRLNKRKVEITDKINGKVRDTEEISLSPDGKSLTITMHLPGRSEPNLQVFDKES